MVSHARSARARNDIIKKVAEVLRAELATIGDIETAVDKASVKRAEVDASFGSMHGLLLAMVSALSDELIRPLERDAIARTLREVLLEFADQLAKIYSISHLVALYRLTLSEAKRHAGIGRDFYDKGPGRLAISLAHFLYSYSREHRNIYIDDAKCSADRFLELLEDTLEGSNWMTATETRSLRCERDAVIQAVDEFCNAIAMQDPATLSYQMTLRHALMAVRGSRQQVHPSSTPGSSLR